MDGRTARDAERPRKREIRQPRQARSRHTVETILEGAARVLSERGWAGFTTNVVAQRAGVSIGSLYEYFRCKEDLASAIVDRHLAAAERLVAERSTDWAPLHDGEIGPSIDPDRIVPVLVDGFVELHAHDPALHRVLASQVPLKDAHRTRMKAIIEAVAMAVERSLPPSVDHPERTARVLVSVADTLTHGWIVEGGAPLPEVEMRREIERVLHAYLRESERGVPRE